MTRKIILCFACLCLLAGCAEIEVPQEEGGTATYKGLPVAINVRGSQALPVEVKTEVNESIPVRLDVQGDSMLPIKLDVGQNIPSVPVEIKLSKNALVIVSIAGGIVLLIAVICFFAALSAAHSAKAVSESVDTMTKTRQQSDAETFNDSNG